ncbi:uncharacterized protein LOC109852609 isoform X2 [Pseudomyrmex gracilis]|uniref:uncharacterized protein LOC109852609 isoform X2 n=1 Tax=Pseudomyrmex gracilis TaxID=219809 RepID=UPI00099531AE|nr:uncharacterized protein LOC109852609 isoform X2 [Pseudomyrmex gracilis]
MYQMIRLISNTSAIDLQDIYFSTVKWCLEHIPLKKHWYLSHEVCNSDLSENNSATECALRSNVLQTVLCLLSNMNFDTDTEIEFLNQFYPVLFKTRHVNDIELALYSKKNEKLFDRWLSLWNKSHACSESVATLSAAYRISENMFEMIENSKIILRERELLKRISKRQLHWLNDILDICHILAVNRKYAEVELLLSCDLLKPLYPVLLFKALNECAQENINSPEDCDNGILICESFKFLLDKYSSYSLKDRDLFELHLFLTERFRIIEYILHWKKKHFTETRSDPKKSTNSRSDATEQQTTSVKGLLSLLQKHNTLFVLKIATNIHKQDCSAVQDLLNIEESHTFRKYCCIVNALRSILSCEFYNAKYDQIAGYMVDMASYLFSLPPLSKIETIKDVFSLLFLRYEDFNANSKDERDTLFERTNFSETVEHEKSGFIANKYIVRDMLHYLWKCITDEEVGEDKAFYRDAIGLISVLKNARWKLTFYTGSSFVENVGVPQDESDNISATNKSEPVMSQSGPNFPHRRKKDTIFYNGCSTSDEIKIKSESDSESVLSSGNVKQKKRSRVATADSSRDKPSFMNLMLASRESLILHCLWKSDLDKAQGVIEMFHMENTQLDGEVQFSKGLRAFKQDILQYLRNSDTTDSSKESTNSSILENVRLAAQEGVQSSKHINQLETFLGTQESYLQMLNTDVLSNRELLTFSALDLSTTMSQTYQISKKFCNVAFMYATSCERLYSIQKERSSYLIDIEEYSSFFFKICQLFHDVKNTASVTDILCDARIPLSAEDWTESRGVWCEFGTNYRAFRDLERRETTRSRDNNYSLGLETLKKMRDLFDREQKYLPNVFSHLLLVCSIIPENANVNTVSDLLRTPLHRYFGYQIFDLKTEPDKLETIASDLQVNLIHSILVNACPNISCHAERSYSGIKNTGCIILNQNYNENRVKSATVKGVNPNQCVTEILAELLQILRDVSSGRSYFDNSCLKGISDRADVRAVLNKTSSFANLDLSELSVGDETLAFFLNVWNIMFLHASLDVWSNDPPFNDLRHAVSLMSIGYVIGDLGLVTLAALRSKLLGNLADDFRFFTRIEELNELAWQDLDLVQNSRVIFAMANEFYGTPEIRVFETQMLDKNLNDAMRDYTSHYSSLDQGVESTDSPTTRKRISLPDFVRRYKNAFSPGVDSATNVNGDAFPKNELDIFKEDTDAAERAYIFNYTYEIILKYSEHNLFNIKSSNKVETLLWETRTLRSSLVQYLESHCWLLSYLLQRMYSENSIILDVDNNYDNVKRTACLENLLSSAWIDKLKSFFSVNQTVTAIHDAVVPAQELWRYLQSRGEDRNWQNSLEIINALADTVTQYDTELQRFKDLILSHVLSNLGVLSVTRMLQYLYQIKDIHVLTQTILHNINKWPMNVCEHALLHALQHEFNYKLPAHCKHRMNGVLCRIMIFHKMTPYCVSKSNSTWYDVMYCTDKIEPFEIIKSLINADQFELCLEWLECQAFSLEIQPTVIQDFLLGLLRKEQQDFKQALKFLQALPSSQSVKICKTVLKKLESISALQFVANYLLEHCKPSEQSKYQKTLIGLEILEMLENKDRALYIHLIKEPLLMLEQLLMNCKFENIQKILNTLHKNLQHPDVSIGNFDKIIRFYAKKSLDFRVSLQRDGVESRVQTPSQSTSEAESNDFVMPVNVPTKEEWVPNDRAKECSCCKAVIFSMFNRRHHCRRCGRVVCAVCSQHRMQVAGYPSSVLVRVCDDCKCQTVLQMRAAQDAPSTSSSEVFDYWRLTRDEKHNRTIREEFSFEHAPNISLCLAILNLHSDHKIYTSFLLDRCDEMKQLLQPVNGGRINPEVDHAVIIKMIRSLLIAVKVKCAKLGFNTGLAHCDRFLSQVDLIATLIQSDCLTLIPTDDLDEHTLRKLRDLLTEKEQWTLALNVSTKAGLDTQGVWAAWGKACLKVGYLDQAREKFHHCLDKMVYEDVDDWVVLSYSREPIEKNNIESTTETTTSSVTKRKKTLDERKSESDGHSKRSEYSRCRPLKDPPLLTEILQILDNLSIHRFRAQNSSQSRSDAAQEILQTLNSLKAVTQNQFNVKHMIPTNQTIYYQESLYYLSTYGSSSSILQFFLKHKEFDKCMAYILENDLECELFLNAVYLHCLKNGDIERLHDAMKAKDPSLLAWRKYLIFACHFMEKKQHWHILYQIQLFMRDCIRASMTCIRFYTNEANTYSDLYNRMHLLQDAQKHLESELQIESLSKRRRSVSSIHSGQAVLTMEMEPSEIDRHINTICRQTEIAKFLANCEKEGRTTSEFLNLFPNIDNDNSQTARVPTLFGNQQEKIHLAVLAILCGRDIGEGFGIAFRIIQDYNLPQQKIYSLAGHVLALKSDLTAIEQLIKCCRSSGVPNTHVVSDHVLTHCVKLLLSRSYSEQNPALRNHIDILIRLITDTELRINAYIESKQLKAAYLLAVKHSRTQDIRRILRESDRLGQSAIKMICLKWLQQELKE